MPPRKQPVRPPSVREALLARRRAARARLDELRDRFVEPVLARFPGLLPTRPDSAARYAIVSSIIWFAIGLLLALLLAVKLVFPRLLAEYPWMSYGRLAAAEAAVMTWGALFTGFLGAMFAVVPRVTGVRLWSERIGAQTVILLDQVVLAGVVLVLIGRTQGINDLELPWPIDLLLLAVMLMAAQNVAATVARRAAGPLAIPVWYYLAAVIVLPATYAFGNIAASWTYGVDQQIVAGFAVAGTAAGLLLMGAGTAYYVVPKATGRPVYSDRVALVGFWSLLFAAPWVGQVRAVLGPGPDHLETVAVTFAVWLVIPALAVLVNLWGTVRDARPEAQADPAARFALVGAAFLLLAAVHQGVGSLRTMQNIVGETPWQIAGQTAAAGGLGLILVGLVCHLFPRMIGRALYRPRWAIWQLWLTAAGLATVVVAMSVAGVVQGFLQVAGVQTGPVIGAGEHWASIALATRPLFVLRIGGGALVFLGLLLFVRNLIGTATAGEEIEVEQPAVAARPAEPVGAGA